MNEQDLLKGARRVKLASILQGQTFYRTSEKELDLKDASPAEFDTWALALVEDIDHVNREMWDPFARWKFVNWAIDENVLDMAYEGEKIILTEVPTEEKSSAANVQEQAS